MTNRAALISVSNKEGIIPFATELSKRGWVLLCTGGTKKLLDENQVPTLAIEEYTAQPEILDGRVKTLHPKIHAGILARRDDPDHRKVLEVGKILPIDLVIVNLYPFLEARADGKTRSFEEWVELIDIGGPTMLRAAAKNFHHSLPVIDPADYSEVLSNIDGSSSIDFRKRLTGKVFEFTARYDLEIARFFHGQPESSLSGVEGFVGSRLQSLRYGENPHQQAALYSTSGNTPPPWRQLSGKELSYNNLLDFDASFHLIRRFQGQRPTAVILKHLNPCGAAQSSTLLEALTLAKRSDPRSHFGGILAFNASVTADVADSIREDFAEVVVAPAFEAEALELLKQSKALRVIEVSFQSASATEVRSIEGGMLVQRRDDQLSSIQEARRMTGDPLTNRETQDLEFAWRLCAHVKSNAIVVVKDGLLVGTGAGQMSRIDSVEVALWKAREHKHNLEGAVAASDAFFPFPDGLETLIKAGVRSVIAPSGAKRDPEVVALAQREGIQLLFAQDRHFRH